MQPKLSIVIPTHKNIFLKETLISIIHCFGFNSSIEIVVVENPKITEDVTKLIHEVYNDRKHNIKHVCCDLGANKARNVGVKVASSSIIALLDDDCIVDRNWINAILSVHTVYPNVGVVGGPLKLVFKTEKPRWVDGYFWSMLAGVDHGNGLIDFSWVNDRYSGMIVSGNMSFRKFVFEQTQGFDETVGYIGKDSLMAHDEIRVIYECSQLGLPKRLYSGNIIAYHYIPEHRVNLEYFAKRAYGDGFNLVRIIINDKDNDDKTKDDILIEHILPRWHQYLTVEEIAQIRARLAHEETTRLYISNVMKCKTEFMRGCFDCLNLYRPQRTQLSSPMIIENTNAII